MFGKPKGYVKVKAKIEFSKKPGIDYLGNIDLTEDYFNALQGKLVTVIEVAVDNKEYLVFGRGEKSGGFLWFMDKRDTIGEMFLKSDRHQLLDREPDLDDFMASLKILANPRSSPCENFLNQDAIDKALQKANREAGEYVYQVGRNVCIQCAGRPILKAGGYRVCFQARTQEVKRC